MKIISTPVDGVLLIEPKIFNDDRGSFFESFNQKELSEAGVTLPFVQDNQSISSKNVIRGLHFQRHPNAQGKLVRVVKGSVIDVIVDLRKDSLTFGRHYSVELNDKSNQMLWVPPGIAHGFSVLEDQTTYKLLLLLHLVNSKIDNKSLTKFLILLFIYNAVPLL